MRALAAVTALMLASSSTAQAEPTFVETDTDAHHVIHGAFTTLALINGASINYEYHFSDTVALRVGYGASVVFIITDVETAAGPLAALVLLWGKDHHFELDLGLSLVLATSQPLSEPELFDDWYLGPTLYAGYRYQPERGGLVFRLGAAWEVGYALPFSIGIGAAF